MKVCGAMATGFYCEEVQDCTVEFLDGLLRPIHCGPAAVGRPVWAGGTGIVGGDQDFDNRVGTTVDGLQSGKLCDEVI